MNIPGLGSIFGSVGLELIVPGVLNALGMQLKNKDVNNTGADDVGGNLLIALGPLVPAIIHGDVRSQRQVVQTAIAALQSYEAALPLQPSSPAV